ncbi:helix-turn-helix domain-containing protein [Phenylobacterium aquaticum]|uniref:helix-turn-helix domain-containing protein n=1 Tax=Phenylobacterium aquaticum TaxID=1763816 RepID=UPI0026EC6F7D|nr:XRE family transcriptional regulator [Phenylobacterium aquaticum]
MSDDPIEIERGSGNVFSDLGFEDAGLRQFKALLAAEIIKTLNARELTVRAAAAQTGFAAADFSRVRNVRLERFTIDRLMTILGRLGLDVKVQLSVRPRDDDARRSAQA